MPDEEGALPMAPHDPPQPPHHLPHRFDRERMASRHERFRQELPPETMLNDLIPDRHATLADIGCGPGFFTLAAARLLPEGHVFAIDLQADMLAAVRVAAEAAGLTNITTIEADAAALPLDDGSVDAVLMARFLVDTPAKDAIVAEAARILRPGGRLYLLQWDRVPTPMGPPFHIRLAAETAAELLRRHGLSTVRIWREPSPFYRLLAVKEAKEVEQPPGTSGHEPTG
jgi:ubiquinone/menaquinone biosynthesis C-methylase UbiE